MKKMFNLMLLGLGALFLAAKAADTDDALNVSSDVSGHTFYKIRPPFQAASPEQVSLFRGRALMRDCGMGGAVQVVPYGGQTTNQKGLGRFFSFCGKDSLEVKGDGILFAAGEAVDAGTGLDYVGIGAGRDVNPSHFGIITIGGTTAGGQNNFQSTISFRPRQTFAGVGIEWRQYLGWCDMWLDISVPVEWVKNKVNLTEANPTLGGSDLLPGTPQNMTQAFTGQYGFGTAIPTKWAGGIIDDSIKHTKAGVADIELKLGCDYLDNECAHADGYVGVLIPTGNKPRGYYVFEPIIGDNGHVGIITGGSFGYNIWGGDCGRELWLTVDMNSRYEFKNTQTRSFDVCGKPWSRYQAVYQNTVAAGDGALTPGINLFTKRVNVTPRFWHNYTLALVFNQCNFQAELGYNFWARQAEKVTLKDTWAGTYKFAALTFDGTGTFPAGAINPLVTIGANGRNNITTEIGNDAYRIAQTDLDMNSAAMPAQLSHTVYGSLGYTIDFCNFPMFVGVGGSYEFSGVNTAISRWMAWGKFGISF